MVSKFYLNAYLGHQVVCNAVFKSKGKVNPITCHEGTEKEQKYSSALSSTSVLERVGWLMLCPICFTPQNYPLPMAQKDGLAQGQSARVWKSHPAWGFSD